MIRSTGRETGFTLIEVMVVMVIVALMATGISVSIGALQGREASQAVERLRLVLEASAERAEVRGQPIAVEFLADGYRFSVFDTDGSWRPLVDPPVFSERILPPEIAVSALMVEGVDRSAEPRLVFASSAPEFRLTLASPDGPVELVGRVTGAVERHGGGG